MNTRLTDRFKRRTFLRAHGWSEAELDRMHAWPSRQACDQLEALMCVSGVLRANLRMLLVACPDLKVVNVR